MCTYVRACMRVVEVSTTTNERERTRKKGKTNGTHIEFNNDENTFSYNPLGSSCVCWHFYSSLFCMVYLLFSGGKGRTMQQWIPMTFNRFSYHSSHSRMMTMHTVMHTHTDIYLYIHNIIDSKCFFYQISFEWQSNPHSYKCAMDASTESDRAREWYPRDI